MLSPKSEQIECDSPPHCAARELIQVIPSTRAFRRNGRSNTRNVLIAIATVASVGSLLPGCNSRPSHSVVLLFVADTMRADAMLRVISGQSITPQFDALAKEGIRYSRAYAPAPWTLPSHVTLFTGLPPRAHGVDWRNPQVPDSLLMLAEALSLAGYQTRGYSENPWVSKTFNLAQGFEEFAQPGHDSPPLEIKVRRWLAERDPERPLFLFINVVDAHWPYDSRGRNQFLPAGVDPEFARSLSQWPSDYFCSREDQQSHMAIHRGLYLGDVAAADAKLALVMESLAEAGLSADTLTIATADHGEHFGEQRLVSHQFSLREPVLRIPLVVHGLKGGERGIVDAPTHLGQIVASLASWLAIPLPTAPRGHALPMPSDSSADAIDAQHETAQPIIAQFRDPSPREPREEPMAIKMGRAQANALRTHCAGDDRVWGDMRALIHGSLKILWYERYPIEVYDLSCDPLEEHELSPLLDQASFRRITQIAGSGGAEGLRAEPELLSEIKAVSCGKAQPGS